MEMDMTPMMTVVGKSCAFTARSTAKADHPRAFLQRVPKNPYQMMSPEQRTMRFELLAEEFREVCKALGFEVDVINRRAIPDVPDMEGVIDGACDLIYVATGLMTAMNVPDAPHLMEVCARNNAKFPNGVATIHPDTGKYLKPDGWHGPDHRRIAEGALQQVFVASFLERASRQTDGLDQDRSSRGFFEFIPPYQRLLNEQKDYVRTHPFLRSHESVDPGRVKDTTAAEAT